MKVTSFRNYGKDRFELLAVRTVPDLDALPGAGGTSTCSILKAESGKNMEGGDGSSYPTAPRCSCRSATAKRVGR
jgi:hypothetical protein